jgi:DNA-binding winged helix-turn-helix (wHTH) protein/tetratricopeptide (TPR) repeat protein
MNQPRRIYEFESFTLDIGERRLLRNGRPVPLRAKVFDTLRVLVESHGRLVAKDALIKAVWPDAIVEEGNLAHNVAALRRALRSSGAQTDHIETVPGQGYRFAARISAVREAGGDEAISTDIPIQPQLSWDHRLQAARTALASASTTDVQAASRRRHVVGRGHEMRQLITAVESARAGRGMVVGLSGEPGIGKSTLVEHFLADQPTWGREYLVAVGRCSELLATSDAYLPILDALDGLLRSACGRECGELLKLAAPTWFLQVQPLWAAADPSFAAIAADAKAASRERMKRELVRFLQEISRARPLALVLDDLHWADASTVEFIDYLSDKLDSLRTVVLITYRPEEMVRVRHPFLGVRQSLQRRDRFREIALGLLSHNDVAQYVSLELPDADLEPRFVDFVHQRTEGNPLFVTDLVKHLRDRDVLSERGGRWRLTTSVDAIGRDVPASVSSVIARRIDQVHERNMDVLVAASVQGHQFESRIVADVCGLDAADVEDRLSALERVHALIRVIHERQLPDSSVSVSCAFAHVLYQHAIADDLTPSRRAELSKRTAEALLRRYATTPAPVASQLAYLFESARDFERAADFFLIAARNAAALFANEEAVALSGRAIACAEKLEGLARHSRVFLATIEMAQLQMGLSRFADAAVNYEAAERTAADAGDIDGQIRAVCGHAAALFTLQRLDELPAEGERAVRLAQGSTSQIARATADTLTAIARMNDGDLEAAEQGFSRAIPVLRQEQLWVQSLDAISFRGLLHHMRLEFDHVEQTSGWAIDQARRLGATFHLVENLFCWGMALANRGRLTQAIDVVREGIRIAELNGERSFVARLSNTHAWLYRQIHDIGRSLRLGADAVRLARELQVRDAEVHAHINLAGDYLELLDSSRAGEHLREAQQIVTQDHIFQWRQKIRVEEVAAAYWLVSGDLDKASAHAITALEQAKQTLSRKHIAWSRKLLGDIALRHDRHAEAATAYESALKILDAHPCPLIEWKILMAWAAALPLPRGSARATALRAKALSIKQSLAESIADDTDRRRFLAGEPPGFVA